LAETQRSTEVVPVGLGGGINLRFVLVFLCIPCTQILPFWVYDTHRSFDEPDAFAFYLAVLGMIVTIVILEAGLWFARELWQEEVKKLPPGKPLPKVNPSVIYWWVIVVWTQLMGLGVFYTTMDGGLRWAAARWVYLGYAVPALILVASRWRRWTQFEQLFLRWGWAPVFAFGVPLALPRLLAAGLITNPWD
jgi:hypothetical protein